MRDKRLQHLTEWEQKRLVEIEKLYSPKWKLAGRKRTGER